MCKNQYNDKKVKEDSNLAMRWGLKLELVSHTDHSRSILGLCKDVKIAIRRLKTKHPISMVEAEDYDLVWGKLFLNSVKFIQKYKPDKVFGTITHLFIQQTTVFRTSPLQNLINQREN